MKNLIAALSILLLASLSACLTKSKVSSAAFGKYISGFTSGTVHPDDEIRIELAQALLDSTHIDRSDTAFLEKALDISPSVKGTFYWKNEKTIAFRPLTRFADGKQYHVSLNLRRFKKVSSEFKEFDFFFETEKQKVDVSLSRFAQYDDYSIEWQQFELTVTSNMALDTQALAVCFQAEQEGRKLHITCVPDGEHRYRITADSIIRGEKASMFRIRWNTAKVNGEAKGDEQLKVPGLGNYTVTKMEVTDDGDQKLNITFSDPIYPRQNLDGLIEVEDARKLQFNITGNVVSVFFPERLDGEKKVTIRKGLLNFRQFKMDSTTSGVAIFRGPKPALRMDSKGCILPNSQGLLFPFESIGIHTVDVRIIKIKEQNIHQFLQVNELDGNDEMTRVGKIAIEKTVTIIADTVTPQNQWTTHILDLGKLIQPEPGSLYRVCIRFKKKYTYLPCRNQGEEQDSEYIYDVAPEQDSTWNEYGWHGEGFDGYNTWRYDEDEPCEDRYYRGGAICKNILASDIGVMYQEEKNKTAKIVTTNLLNAQALPYTEVTLYAYTQEKIAQGVTDENGFLQVSLSQKPFLLVARKDKQRAYLKLTNSNTLSTSKFDVEGLDQGSGLKGFLYAERGVWRPCDSVFLNFVLNDRNNPLPDKHPIQFELRDPDGKLLFKRMITEHSGRMYPLYFQTSDNAPMGTYTASVTIGNAVFSKNILLEYIVPNRMKLLSNVDNRLLTAKDSATDVKVSWLNGATGRGLKTQANVTLRADGNYFNKFEDYNFIAPYNENFHASFELKEAVTNDSGTARFNNSAMQVPNCAGMLRSAYVFKAFEQGGGFSIDKATSSLSLLDAYVGIRKPKGTSYYGSLDYSKNYNFGYVVADKNQQKVSGHHLQLKIYEMQYQRWYEADENDLSSFRTQTTKICVKDTQWVAVNGEGTFSFGNISKKYGRYMIILKDLATGHETGCISIFDDPYWDRYSSGDADYEAIVQLSASKASFNVGDKIQITVPSGENANVLINIESDSKILQQFWIKGNTAHKPVEFLATKDMAPGIYIHATVLQPHHYIKDGSPIRQYGILPVRVDDPDTRLKPVISMADEIRPETASGITISEEQGKEMYYSLVLVDEGLLNLTHFKKPDIWQQMNAQQSLKIKTWDMFNQVIGAYSGKIQHVFSIGGDGSYDESENTKAKRFKPAIINLGNFHLKAGQKLQHHFSVPNYSGSMKAFVVAYCDGRSGSSEKAFFVRKPLMLLTSAPRMMSAGESYTIPVTVFNMDRKAKRATVSMDVTGLSGYKKTHTQMVDFKTEGDEVVNFAFTLPEEAGVLAMDIAVSDGKERSKEHIDIQVKPTQPPVNHQTAFVVEPGATQVLNVQAKGIKGSYSNDVSISDIMNFNMQHSLDYLISYPHGCVEQTTSSAFAQLFLNDVQDLDEQQAASVKKHVELVIRRLSQYQTYSGGFAYWPYQDEVNDFASVYVLHFMNEARRKGFEVPKYLYDNAVNYQKNQATGYTNTESASSYVYQEEELTQAYRLYLLTQMNMSDMTAMNKLKEAPVKGILAKALLAGAYKNLGRGSVAAELMPTVPLNVQQTLSTGFSSTLRDRSMLLMALKDMGNTVTNQKLAEEICSAVSRGWNSTLATSMALVSLSEYYGSSTAGAKRYSINGHAGLLQKHTQTVHPTQAANGQWVFKNTSDRKMFLQLNEHYAETGNTVKLSNNGLKLKVAYTDMKGAPIDESSLPHGSNFMARIQVSNTTNVTLQHVALEYYIANGWQFISNRYMDAEDVFKNSDCDFKNVQDERINMFFDINANETKTFYVQLNASYKGRFYIPITQSYPMYNEYYKAQLAGKWVTVK